MKTNQPNQPINDSALEVLQGWFDLFKFPMGGHIVDPDSNGYPVSGSSVISEDEKAFWRDAARSRSRSL